MKKVIIIFLAMVILLSGCKKSNSDTKSEYKYMGSDYVHHLSQGYCVMRTSASDNELIYYPTWQEDDVELHIKETILSDVTIYKYGSSKDGEYIYIHYYKFNDDCEQKIKFNGMENGISDNVLYLYSIENKSFQTFENENQFNDYCKDNNIVFDKYYYPSAGGSIEENRVGINDFIYISDKGKYRGQAIVNNDVEIFCGYINKYAIVDDNTICFQLKLADSDYDEEFLGSANKDLNVDKSAKQGIYFFDSIHSFKVYYSKYILYNSLDKTVMEFESKKELSNYIEKGMNLNLVWNKLS